MGIAKACAVILYCRQVDARKGTRIDVMNMHDVGAQLAAVNATGAGNFRSSAGKMVQLLKEFLAYALLTF